MEQAEPTNIAEQNLKSPQGDFNTTINPSVNVGPAVGDDIGSEDESEDVDYDPSKPKPEEEQESSDSDDEPAASTQVRTRSQRYQETGPKLSTIRGEANPNLDFDSLFNNLKSQSLSGDTSATIEWLGDEGHENLEKKEQPKLVIEENDDIDKVWIKASYTFAGKIITESKQVDANSAEAKAFLNSTGIQMDGKKYRSFVPVIRTIPGESEPIELKIKIKRPSLIDKFLNSHGNKRMKLSTLEKSRLDWASFVDTSKIQDELKSHNKDGYLERQDFLGRVAAKRDEHYDKARAEERLRKEQQL